MSEEKLNKKSTTNTEIFYHEKINYCHLHFIECRI